MFVFFFFCCFFFFKHKTAYEMRISDWSSDVCSSDLWQALQARIARRICGAGGGVLTMAGDGAVLPTDVARQVIDPHAYAEWHGLLDTFDRLRVESPVARVVPEDGKLFDPFWLVTRHEDVMRLSKDNATFLNNPRPVVFSF